LVSFCGSHSGDSGRQNPALPDEAKLVFCRDLEKFIKRQERLLPKA
jgi:hypothetical protein